MFHKLDMKHLGDKRAPVFLKMEGFSWLQGIPGFLQDKSKAEKGNQLKLEWMKVVVQVQFLLSIPVEPEKEVTDVWFATSFRAQNDSQKLRNALDLLPGCHLDKGFAAHQIMAEQRFEFLVHHDC